MSSTRTCRIVGSEARKLFDDARAMLEALRDLGATGPKPKLVSFHFEHTDAFEQLARTQRAAAERTASGAETHDVLDQLRLEPELFQRQAERALSRVLAQQAAERAGVHEDALDYQRAVEAFRRTRGLYDAASMREFLARQDLDAQALEALLRADARAERVRVALGCELEQALIEQLKLDGHFGRLATAAAQKAAWRKRRGLEDAPVSPASPERDQALLGWYAELLAERCDGDPDRAQLLQSLCFTDAFALLMAARREHQFRTQHTQERPDEEEPVHR